MWRKQQGARVAEAECTRLRVVDRREAVGSDCVGSYFVRWEPLEGLNGGKITLADM